MWHIVKKMALVVLLLYSAKGKAQSVAYSSVTATIVTDVNQLSLAERGFADISYGEMKFSNTGFSNVETSGQRYIITKPGKISVVAARLIVTGGI